MSERTRAGVLESGSQEVLAPAEITGTDIHSGEQHEHAAQSAMGAGNDEHRVHAHHGYMADRERYLSRLRRIEGQVRGVHKMVENETYCIDILTQISALTSAIENVALALLDDHMRHCVMHAAQHGGQEADEKFKEAAQAIARLVKS